MKKLLPIIFLVATLGVLIRSNGSKPVPRWDPFATERPIHPSM
ncbi:hypothetical protein [Synechococcus phage S-B68]|nr:hypothetical protein [Synechococcus phage S-B68]